MTNRPPSRDGATTGRAEWGSDVVVEMMQAYHIDYAPTNLGATFRGLLDSLVTFGENNPEVIECLHEEIAVSIAHGYARVTDRPLVALVHNVVGTLHAAMAIYDAYAGRAPMIIMSGTGPMSLQGRRPWIDWVHTALVQGNLVRDYVKWDDQPHDPLSVPESFMRGYRVAMTEPKGPVYITLDAGWQEAKLDNPIPIPDVSLFDPPTRMMADPDALRRVAQMLNEAELPLIVAGRVGKNRDAVGALVELAEAGGISVVDAGGSLNFPNTNHLDATDTDLLLKADFILLLETDQAENVLVDRNRYTRETWSRIQENAKVASIGTSEVWIRSTIMDFGKLYPKEISILGDTSLAIPQLTEDLNAVMAADPGSEARKASRIATVEASRAEAQAVWKEELDAVYAGSGINHARISAELWKLIEKDKWVFAGGSAGWPRRIWTMDRPGSVMGAGGAAALGTSLPKSVGSALAAKQEGGFGVSFNGDGDMLYVPTTVWTAVHHKIPMLVVVLDNGGYVGEGGHVSWTSEHRGRSTARADIAVDIKSPRIDLPSLAAAQGAYVEGPVEDGADLGPALERAYNVMKEQSTIAVVVVRVNYGG